MAVERETKQRTYGVKLVRGPFVRLPPHELTSGSFDDLVELASDLRAAGHLLSADLFCGAGGLSLGLERAGWTCILGIDHDKEAVETHAHHFPGLTADWDLSDETVVEEVGDLLGKIGVDLIAGGPPCQPFSGDADELVDGAR